MTKYLMAALAVAVAAVVLALSFPAGAQLQEITTVAIDPRIAPEIERDGEIKVLISLRDIDVIDQANGDFSNEMFSNVDWDLRTRHAQEVQAIVRAALRPEDAAAIVGFKTSPALGATITASGLEKLRNHPDVVGIGAAELGSYSLSESAALIWAGSAHSAGYDGSGIDVAVLDTGIDTDHPDLSDSLVYEFCDPVLIVCGPSGHRAEDSNGHGTWVSGTITSNGTVAPLGIAPEAGIYAYRVGSPGPDTLAVLSALEDIQAHGYPVDFVNMSFNMTPSDYPGTCDVAGTTFQQIELHLAALRFNGVLAFAASGNDGDKSRMPFPACNEFVVSVGAVHDKAFSSTTLFGCTDSPVTPDLVPCWSNSSDVLDLLAPGCRITTTAIGGGAGLVCGTSFASPIAVGVAALLKDAQPGLTPDQILQRMKSTGQWVFDSAASRWTPRVDARVALLIDDNADWDGDGCRNGAEYTLGVDPGTWRNPLDSEDYYDVSIPKDGVIDLPNDILGVISHFSPGGAPPYDVYFDRGITFLNGPYPWKHGPRDGVIDLSNDILSVSNQFNPGGC